MTWDFSEANEQSRETIKHSLINDIGVSSKKSDDVLNILCNLYAGRKYHNLNHVAYCLESISHFRESIYCIEDITLALMFHDCIYTGNDKSDVIASANIGASITSLLDVGFNAPERVKKLIKSTYNHIPTNDQESIICDIDMKILSDYWDKYQNYADCLRQEYYKLGATESEFDIGRASFLRHMISKDIYHHPSIKDKWQKVAINNMKTELDILKRKIENKS